MSSHGRRLRGNVPFSWENKPGVCKAAGRGSTNSEDDFLCIKDMKHSLPVARKLPPPPCPKRGARVWMSQETLVPLPPCTFQPPLRSSSGKGMKKEDDPFLAAYRECTKSTGAGGGHHRKYFSGKHDVGWLSGLGKHMRTFSCKRSCSVRDDNLIRISHFPRKINSHQDT